MINYILYAATLLISVFAVSGINFNHIIKTNHIWEARFLSVILIICFSYILTHFILDFI